MMEITMKLDETCSQHSVVSEEFAREMRLAAAIHGRA